MQTFPRWYFLLSLLLVSPATYASVEKPVQILKIEELQQLGLQANGLVRDVFHVPHPLAQVRGRRYFHGRGVVRVDIEQPERHHLFGMVRHTACPQLHRVGPGTVHPQPGRVTHVRGPGVRWA